MKPQFHMFALDHLLALAAVALLSLLAFKAAHGKRAHVYNTMGGIIFSFFAVALWLFRLGDGFQADLDLPLWLCDLAFLLCVACFFRPTDLMLTLVAYWGLAGTLQAMITPDLPYGFPSREYFLFFIGHGIIVLSVFFLLGKSQPAGLPTAHGVVIAFLGLLVYTGVIGLLDVALGWNYGYLTRKPAGASILDKFGEWPFYVLQGLALALILFFLVAGLLRLVWKSAESDCP